MVEQNQFGGFASENPNFHFAMLLQVRDTVKMNGVNDDVIQLRFFHISLRDKAFNWLHTLQLGAIVTWEEMVDKCLNKFFPPSKCLQLRSEIS